MCFERRRVEVNYNIWFACVCPRQTINQFASKQCCDKLVRSIKACPAPSPTISFWPTQLFQYVWDCERVPRWILFYWKSGVTQFSRLVTFHNRGGTQTLCLWQTYIILKDKITCFLFVFQIVSWSSWTVVLPWIENYIMLILFGHTKIEKSIFVSK